MGAGGFPADNDHRFIKESGGGETAFPAVRIGIEKFSVAFFRGGGQQSIKGVKPSDIKSSLRPHAGTHRLVAPGINSSCGVPQFPDSCGAAAAGDGAEVPGVADAVKGKDELP